jgi:hypothetical protein
MPKASPNPSARVQPKASQKKASQGQAQGMATVAGNGDRGRPRALNADPHRNAIAAVADRVEPEFGGDAAGGDVRHSSPVARDCSAW